MIDLTPVVYSNVLDMAFLYKMLQERDGKTNISHVAMPTVEQHEQFVRHYPYRIWYIIKYDDIRVGNIYMTVRDEIGIHIIDEYQRMGIGTNAVKMMMNIYKRPCYFNVSPRNEIGINFIEKMTKRHIHNTYLLESE